MAAEFITDNRMAKSDREIGMWTNSGSLDLEL